MMYRFKLSDGRTGVTDLEKGLVKSTLSKGIKITKWEAIKVEEKKI